MGRKKNIVAVEVDVAHEPTLEQEIAAAIERTKVLAGAGPLITSRKREGLDAPMEGARDARKPDLAHLPDAVTLHPDGSADVHFDVGSRIVIERYALTIPGNPWLDTQTYTVQSIDPVSGVLQLWNPDLYQAALTNFRLGLANGFKFKLASARGTNIGKKKRGRPRKNPVDSTPAPTPKSEKKGRGRPKGVKNRAKDVIVAERKAKAAEQAEKKRAKARR